MEILADSLLFTAGVLAFMFGLAMVYNFIEERLSPRVKTFIYSQSVKNSLKTGLLITGIIFLFSDMGQSIVKGTIRGCSSASTSDDEKGLRR